MTGWAGASLARRSPSRWPATLSVVLGGCLLLVGAHASVPVLAFASVSAVLVALTPWVLGRRLAAVLLLAGTVPIAVVLWWTLVVPLIAALALLTGSLARGTGV